MRRISLRTMVFAILLSLIVSLLIYTINIYETNGQQQMIECDCPIHKENVSKITQSTSHQGSAGFRPCKEISNTSAVQRAIIIYYPHHQSEYFFPEVRWLYRSWYEMLRGQSARWRTDLIIFTYNFSEEFHQLGCVNQIRQNKEEPSVCRLFIYVPVSFRAKNVTNNNFEHAFDGAKKARAKSKDNQKPLVTIPNVNDPETFNNARSESLYANLRTYGYIDSINTIYEGFSTFKMYDFVLRTDIDVFIYRHFAKYIPKGCTVLTGGGGYGTDFNRRRLKRVARDMNFSYVGVSGMGSTWYGSPYDGFLIANQTLHAMLWLALNEFSMPERESKLGTMLWPEWHYGVLLLYGQHLAINHLVGESKIRIMIASELLDQSSTNSNPQYLTQSIRLNLHCWHTNERFSKFAFKMGHYNKTHLAMYLNDTTAQAYAMRMALESKFMSLTEMASEVRNITGSS